MKLQGKGSISPTLIALNVSQSLHPTLEVLELPVHSVDPRSDGGFVSEVRFVISHSHSPSGILMTLPVTLPRINATAPVRVVFARIRFFTELPEDVIDIVGIFIKMLTCPAWTALLETLI